MVAPPIASAGPPNQPAKNRIASSVWMFCHQSMRLQSREVAVLTFA